MLSVTEASLQVGVDQLLHVLMLCPGRLGALRRLDRIEAFVVAQVTHTASYGAKGVLLQWYQNTHAPSLSHLPLSVSLHLVAVVSVYFLGEAFEMSHSATPSKENLENGFCCHKRR